MFDQKIPAWLIKSTFLREVEIAVRSGDAIWACGFLFNSGVPASTGYAAQHPLPLYVGLPGEQR